MKHVIDLTDLSHEFSGRQFLFHSHSVYFWNKVQLLRASLSEKLFAELPEWLNLSRRLHSTSSWEVDLNDFSQHPSSFFFNLMYNLWPISPPVTLSSDASMSQLLWADWKCWLNVAGFSCLLMYLMRGVRCTVNDSCGNMLVYFTQIWEHAEVNETWLRYINQRKGLFIQ